MDVKRVLTALDEELNLTSTDNISMIICGGAVIRLRYGADIDTNDIDSLTALNARMMAASKRVAMSQVGRDEQLGEG